MCPSSLFWGPNSFKSSYLINILDETNAIILLCASNGDFDTRRLILYLSSQDNYELIFRLVNLFIIRSEVEGDEPQEDGDKPQEEKKEEDNFEYANAGLDRKPEDGNENQYERVIVNDEEENTEI